MGATPIDQLKREALAGMTQPHPADLAEVKAAVFAKHQPTIAAIQAAAAPVLAGKEVK